MFVKVPKQIILAGKTNKKRVIHYVALSICQNMSGQILFSQNAIIQMCGYRTSNKTTGVQSHFRELTRYLEDNEYIQIVSGGGGDSKITFAEPLQRMSNPTSYGVIHVNEFKDIVNFRSILGSSVSPKIMQTDLMLVLSYIRMRMFKSSNESVYCYDYISELADCIGETVWMVSSCISILDGLDIIYFEQLPRYQIEKNWHTPQTIFVNRHDYSNGGSMYDYRAEVELAKQHFYESRKGLSD